MSYLGRQVSGCTCRLHPFQALWEAPVRMAVPDEKGGQNKATGSSLGISSSSPKARNPVSFKFTSELPPIVSLFRTGASIQNHGKHVQIVYLDAVFRADPP